MFSKQSRPVCSMLHGTAWLIAAFYLLAVDRALVPGLCATQRAAVEAGKCCQSTAPDSLRPAPGGCCQKEPLPSGSQSRQGVRCAFCLLATTPSEAPDFLVLAGVVQMGCALPWAPEHIHLPESADPANAGRAPPA